jgi:hypothetical protein
LEKPNQTFHEFKRKKKKRSESPPMAQPRVERVHSADGINRTHVLRTRSERNQALHIALGTFLSTTDFSPFPSAFCFVFFASFFTR